MNNTIKINYYWEEGGGTIIPERHVEALEEDAMSRIFEMVKDGYYQGELNTSVRYGKDEVSEEDEEDGLSYSGWWNVEFNRD